MTTRRAQALAKRKLFLVLDLDHTLLNSCKMTDLDDAEQVKLRVIVQRQQLLQEHADAAAAKAVAAAAAAVRAATAAEAEGGQGAGNGLGEDSGSPVVRTAPRSTGRRRSPLIQARTYSRPPVQREWV